MSKIKKKVIAIIPARKGSKRIRNKNIKKFNGIPIIAHTIRAAKKSKIFDYISVSTDCRIIAKIAKKFGANIDFIRPKKLSDDNSTTKEVIKHALNFYRKKNENFDFACCIYPASPFIDYKNLIKAYKILIKKKYNMITTVQEFPSPVQRAFKIEKDNFKWFNKNYLNKNSNYLSKYYFDSGQFYFGTVKKFIQKKNIIDSKSKAIIIKKYSSIDINSSDDWIFAEKLKKIL